ncbi:hypothetical protein F5B17DRAFT_282875 [Nemania serpens]|nr:hypothetical protein F5B17DRAFT_282875 [Nemania serpens]
MNPTVSRCPLETPDEDVVVPKTVINLEEFNHGITNDIMACAATVTPQTQAMFMQRTHQLIKRGAPKIILRSTCL